MANYQAPFVRFGAGRSRRPWWAVGALAACSALALAGWATGGASKPPFQLAAAAALWLACVTVALHFTARLPQGDLVWDGGLWRFEGAGTRDAAGVLRVHMDGQSHLLLSLREATGTVRWFWLERRMQPERWDDLRRAVYSRPRPDAGQGTPIATADRGQA
ncbi:MAG: hypothetical protein F9K35_01995 [Burkholderiaceae bacterium]|nr:MAG: hypothetical protein F9K35_01995 [Burkholderiaceae bacterium]